MTKASVLDDLRYGILKLESLQRDPDTFISEHELGGVLLWSLSKNLSFLDDADVAPVLVRFLSLLEEFIRSELAAGNMDWLADIFYPGREYWPDRKRHVWWYLPETLMTPAQRKDWQAILDKYPG